MKNSKKIFAIATLLMFCFGIKAFSQVSTTTTTEKTPLTIDQKTAKIVDEMTTVAALTPDEVTKVTPIVKEFFTQKEIDVAKSKGDKNALADARKARMATLKSKIKEVVTQPQFVKITENWNKKKEGKTTNEGVE